MATAQHICKGNSHDPLFILKDNQAYHAIVSSENGETVMSIRDDNRICDGLTNGSLATFRDHKWLYKEDGYVVLYTLRDHNSYLAVCEKESYDNYYTIRDNQSYLAICKGESLDPEFTIRGGQVSHIQLLALLSAVDVLNLK